MAQIEIDTLEEFINFSTGSMGRGTEQEPIDVVLNTDLDITLYEEVENYSWPGCRGTWYCNFDGQNHTIDNISADLGQSWGFFEVLHGSVQNLNLTHMYVIGMDLSAVFAIEAYDSTIYNCHATGQIQATDGNCSCVAGYAENCKIDRCSFSGVLMGLGAGKNAYPIICTGKSSSPSYISKCTMLVNITATDTAGAFGGFGRYTNCIFQGFLKGESKYSPIPHNGSMINCIAVLLSGTTGTLTITNGRAYNCYYDTTTATAAGINDAMAATELMSATTTELKNVTWMNNHGLPCVSG